MDNSFIKHLIELLKSEYVINETNLLLSQIFNYINPYIYTLFFLILFCFFLNLATFLIVLYKLVYIRSNKI